MDMLSSLCGCIACNTSQERIERARYVVFLLLPTHIIWRNVLCTNRLSNLPDSTLTFACVATEEGSTAVMNDQLRLLLRQLPERE